MVIKIFQTKTKALSEIKEMGKFDYEKMIQTLVEQNLEVIFPELEFVISEYQIDDLRPDSIAFNKESKSFVIIEYKKVKHGGVIDQGMAYLDLLNEKKDAFILLYNNEKGTLYNRDQINWEESKIIVIAPEFNPYQLRAVNRTKDPIELYQINRYQDGIITLQRIQKSKELSNKSRSKDSREIIRLDEYSEEDYLAGKYFKNKKPREEAKKLFIKIKQKILTTFSNLEFKQRSKYAGFYSAKDSSAICTLEVTTTNVKLCYCTSRTDILPKISFIRHMKYLSGKKIGHWGIGDYQSVIKNESDVEKAIPLIEKIYNFKVK